MTNYIFTLTGGRTGTAWLAEFLAANLHIPAIHEPLDIDDFGANMPDIRLMRSFNCRGNNALVQRFWAAKLGAIATLPAYAETNHTLGKCGLIENLAASPIAGRAAVIVLRRSLLAQTISHLARGDFRNITISCQWYLDAAYPNVIVNPAGFVGLGPVGHALWYVHEMDARQHYYTQGYGGALRLIEARMEEITKPEGASALLAALGHEGEAVLPPPRNQAGVGPDPRLTEQVRVLLSGIDYDGPQLAAQYIAAGRRLDASGLDAVAAA